MPAPRASVRAPAGLVATGSENRADQRSERPAAHAKHTRSGKAEPEEPAPNASSLQPDRDTARRVARGEGPLQPPSSGQSVHGHHIDDLRLRAPRSGRRSGGAGTSAGCPRTLVCRGWCRIGVRAGGGRGDRAAGCRSPAAGTSSPVAHLRRSKNPPSVIHGSGVVARTRPGRAPPPLPPPCAPTGRRAPRHPVPAVRRHR